MNREKIIINASIKGIIANIMLVIFKTIVGLLSNSIAIVLDAVNNLSDVLSSVITIAGAKLAGKKPDKEHPYGHGRVEYLSAMTISIIILYAGITSLAEAIKKIINPIVPVYSVTTIIILIAAIIVKIFLGIYVKRVGENVNSEALVNSGEDALMDSIISFSTLVAAIIFMTFGKSLEAWLGLVISAIIIKSGGQMLLSTLSQILGERVDRDLAISIKNTINANENVYGAFDLVLNDYGPDIYLGSIHIEVPDTMTAAEIDELTRKLSKEIYEKHRVIMAAIGIYSINTQNKEIIEIRNNITKIVHSYKTVIQTHGFYLNEKDKIINLDIIIDFSDKEREQTFKKICQHIQNEYPEYKLNITLDYDISD